MARHWTQTTGPRLVMPFKDLSIVDAAEAAAGAVESTGHGARVEFNGQRVLVAPGDRASDVVASYFLASPQPFSLDESRKILFEHLISYLEEVPDVDEVHVEDLDLAIAEKFATHDELFANPRWRPHPSDRVSLGEAMRIVLDDLFGVP